ncbi:pentapeptide repeat-containing protein [Actinomadura alba]|uniref:Pentapeptide repeat-containing protein n=1 Tax=Actinomadura alba TaxID=406431 RepID=A0ABR7LYZ3_9ACTN|nr:pentapeptide repeat-containing protein [Actinomadura alba]MBC6470074.1 pentapeptide repeat-containing protein [Actinomadura alba]
MAPLPTVGDCGASDPADPETPCGAEVVAHHRCLVHLTPDERTTYLTTLEPGSDVHVRGVVFTGELLTELLNVLRDDQGIVRIGTGDFSEATFSRRANFSGATFSGRANFRGAKFSGYADFAQVTFSKSADFDRTRFSGYVDFDEVKFLGNADFILAVFFKAASFTTATFSHHASFHDARFSKRAEFSRATFSGRTGFGRTIFSEEAVFTSVTFSAFSTFAEATFSSEANFTEATFSERTAFPEVTFSERAIFLGTTFLRDAEFAQSTIAGDAVFGAAKFTQTARFSETTFAQLADFANATFSGRADFRGAYFYEDARFSRATFAGILQLICCADSLHFDNTIVEADMWLDAAARIVTVEEMRARGRVSLRLRAARVDLTGAVFSEPVTVHGLQHPIPGVDEVRLLDPATGLVPAVAVVSLRGVDAESLVLTDVDLSQCRFTGMHRADQLRLDGRCTFATAPRSRRQVLAEEHHWRAQDGHSSDGWTPAPGTVEAVGPARLEVLYRQLRKALEDAKNEPGAADFYYGEMEMRRNASTSPVERLLLTLYWVVSGYGLRASRALTSLAFVIALLAFGMQFAGFPGQHHPAYLDTLLYSLRAAFSVDVKTAALPESITRWGQVFRVMLRIAGPLFVGLAALAIRNRVKR